MAGACKLSAVCCGLSCCQRSGAYRGLRGARGALLTPRRSFAQRMLYLRDDLQVRRHRQRLRSSFFALRSRNAHALRAQEASSAKYAAEGGLAGHLALKAQRKAQRLAASDERKSKRAQRRRRLRDCLEAMHGSARPPSRCSLRACAPLTHAASHRSISRHEVCRAGDGARAAVLHIRPR
jgi:hypothetical protein